MSWRKWLERAKRRVSIDTRKTAPKAESIPIVSGIAFRSRETEQWYQPVMLGPSTLSIASTSPDTLHRAIGVLEKLDPDDYVSYLLGYYQAGLERFGDSWRYADIVTVLMAASRTLQPHSYLEIGVRRGRSMAMVAATCPECVIVGFDMWMADYAGMANTGPEFVQVEMKKLGHRGSIVFISGNSHETVSHYFSKNPDSFFDLITVDGDHSRDGAIQDLEDVIPHLKIGGVLAFDDICHPDHPYLAGVWQHLVKENDSFRSWEYDELGYGVALAVRVEE